VLIVRAVLGVKFGGMKSTAERLAQSYCRPQTEAEWEMLGDRSKWCREDGVVFGQIPFWKQKRDGKNEIPVQHLSDLVHDRIAPWRLEEDGWTPFEHATAGTAYEYRCNEDALLTFVPLGDGLPEFHAWPTDIDGETGNLSVPYYGIKTYTDLLNLIRLIG